MNDITTEELRSQLVHEALGIVYGVDAVSAMLGEEETSSPDYDLAWYRMKNRLFGPYFEDVDPNSVYRQHGCKVLTADEIEALYPGRVYTGKE